MSRAAGAVALRGSEPTVRSVDAVRSDRSPRPRVRLTKIGLWFCLFCAVLAIAGANTGNNSLLMALAALLALLVVAWLAARVNLSRLALELELPVEVYAGAPARLRYRLANRRRLVPSFDLLLGLRKLAVLAHVAHLPGARSARERVAEGALETLWSRRGRALVPPAAVFSFFPIGFFRASVELDTGLEVLVFPELFDPGSLRLESTQRGGEGDSSERGRGTDLHSLRPFQPGDDPRAIHWKQSARSQTLVYRQAAAEESRRVSVIFDEAGGQARDEETERRWEGLVSEVATACVDHLQRGFEVELVTRRRRVSYGRGPVHRRVLLGELALIDPAPPMTGGLRPGDPNAAVVRFASTSEPPAQGPSRRGRD